MNAFTRTTVALVSSSAVAVSALAVAAAAKPDDKPAKPTKQAAAPLTVAENAGTATVTVTLDKKSKKKVKLNWSTKAGPKATATPGVDFTAVKKGRLVLPAGTKSAELTVPILDDTLVEGDEFFFVKFNGKVANKVKKPRVTVVITDNDAASATPTATTSPTS